MQRSTSVLTRYLYAKNNIGRERERERERIRCVIAEWRVGGVGGVSNGVNAGLPESFSRKTVQQQ